MNRIRMVLAAVFCALFAATALAQDYTTTMVTYGSTYVAPPNGTGKTQHTVVGATTAGPGGTFTNLPFSFPYFGASYDRIWICSQGFIQFAVPSSGGSLEYNNTSWPPASANDGMIAVCWDDLNMDPANGGFGAVYSWTAGTAPNRTFYVSWEGVPHYGSGTPLGSMTFQIQLTETGRITLSYKSTGTSWPTMSRTAGIDAPTGTTNDTRAFPGGVTASWPFFTPTLSGTSGATGTPLRDVQFVPKSYTYSGTLRYDRIVPDASGIGATILPGMPLAGLPVELRRSDGSLGFRAITDATGAFSIAGIGLDGSRTSNLVVVAETDACVVRPAAATAAHVWTIQTGVSHTANLNVGTRTLGAAADSTGETRAPLHIAMTLETTRDWVLARQPLTLLQLDVHYNTSSASPSAYTYAVTSTSTPARLVVGSRGAPNQDAWDDWMLRRAYARHVLGSVAGAVSVASDTRFDTVTDAENAFVEAFGSYLHTAITSVPNVVDGLTPTTATTYDLETLATSQRKGSDVPSRVAAALYDLVDAANETTDGVDGTAGAAKDIPLALVSDIVPPITATSFLDAWIAGGNSGPAASRIWISNGVLDDDVYEPNDAVGEVAGIGSAPLVKQNLVLAAGNEDWFEFQTSSAGQALAVEIYFDRAVYRTGITVQVLNTGGTVIANGNPVGTTGPFRAITSALAVGTYRVKVKHTSGPTIARYAVQVAPPVVFSTTQGTGWTVGRPISVQFAASGGVPPYTFSVDAAAPLPAGLSFDAGTLQVTGTPTTVGTGFLQVVLTDSAANAHVVAAGGAFTVHPAVDVNPGEFTPFALGKSHARAVPVTGGTTPRQLTLGGELPGGIGFNPSTQRFEGTPDAAGFTRYQLDAVDLAGSTDTASGTAVVCVPFETTATVADLPEGDAAAGFWFDGVEGSVASVKIAMAKGAAKRTLLVTAIGPDGQKIEGAVAKGGAGKATVSKLACRRSGRYFVVVSSKSGVASQIVGTVKTVLPTKGTIKQGAFAPGSTIDIRFGALAGAVFKLKVTPDKPSGAKIGLAFVGLPDGNLLDLNAAGAVVKEVANGTQLEVTLPTSGSYRVVVVCRPDTAAKKVGGSWSLRQPAGVRFDAGTAE